MSLPTATQTFTDTNGTALTTHDANWSLNAGDFAIQSNRLVPNGATSTTECAARWNADTFPDDQYAEATIPSLSGGGVNERSGVGVRIATDGSANYYGLYYDDDLSAVQMFKVVAGTWTQLGADFAALAAGNVIRLEVIGTTLEYFKNGVSQGTRTDSSLASGSAGVVGKGISAAQSLDDWTGGSLAPTAAITGTATASITEADIVAGGKTIIATLTNDTFVPASFTPAISYVGGQVGGRAGSTSTSTVTFALTGGTDSTPQAGDYVIITVVVGSAGRNPACAIATPAGYSAIGQLNASTATQDTSMDVSRKFMGGTPDTTFTLPSTGNVQDAQRWTVQVFRNVDPTTPMDVTPVSATGAGVTSRPNPASITPVTAGAYVVINGGGGAATGSAFTAPANYTTDFLTGATADTNDAEVGSGYRAWTSGAEDPATYTGGSNTTSDSWCAYTLALKPAPATTPFASAVAAFISGLDSAQSEGTGWDAVVKAGLTSSDVTRTSDTVVTVTLPAFASYNITAQETITDTIPGSILTSGNPIVASPTFTVDQTSGGGVTLTAGLGQLSVTGFAPSLQQQINAGVGVLTLNGFAPSLATAIIAGLGQLALTGFAPSVAATGNVTLSAGLGQLALTGFAPSLGLGLNAGIGQLVAAGFAPSLGTQINAGTGQLAVTGFAPSLDMRINAAVGQLVLAGFAASLGTGNNLVAALGTLNLTGFAPSVDVTNNISLLAGLGQLIIDGYAPTVTGAEISIPPVVAGTGPAGRRGGLLHELRLLQELEAQEKEAEHRGYRDVRITNKRKELQARVALEQRREAAKKAAEIAAENEDEEALVRIILSFLGGE